MGKVKTKYVNGYSIASNQHETQILFKLSSPIYIEGEASGIAEKDICDIRMTTECARNLRKSLQDVLKRNEDG